MEKERETIVKQELVEADLVAAGHLQHGLTRFSLCEQIKELTAPKDSASLAAAVRKAQFNTEQAASAAEKSVTNKGESASEEAATSALGKL